MEFVAIACGGFLLSCVLGSILYFIKEVVMTLITMWKFRRKF